MNSIATVIDRKEIIHRDGASVLEVRRIGWSEIDMAGKAITASGRIVD